ncbi:MAG: ABC transporter ATP-binding protein [Bacillota bacterium]|nr:ABC transporter ATP-binding protein [Bacillota bacterium]
MNGGFLVVRGLCVEYGGVVRAVDGVSFRLRRGETVGVIGESGSGKTSLALGLLGLVPLPGRVSGGAVLLDGTDLLQLTPRELGQVRGRRVGVVFQNSLEALNPVMRVVDQVAEPLVVHLGMGVGEARRRAAHLLERLGLESRWHPAYPNQLSGGMRQRVLLAMALACDPELLVVDEPTTSLDRAAREEVLDLLRSLQSERGMAMIVLSHDVEAVLRLAGRLLVMYAGRVVEEGAAEAVLERPRHPYTRGLLNASPALAPCRDLWGIPGEPPSGLVREGCAFRPRCTQARAECLVSVPELRPPRLPAGVSADGWRVACHLGGLRTLLKAEGLCKSYRVPGGRVQALDGMSLEVGEGEVVGVVGETGSGKSTLAHLVAGVMPPDAGMVYFEDRPLGPEVARRPGGVQIVFQDPSAATSDRLRVWEAIAEPLEVNRLGDREERLARVEEALRAVQLPVADGFPQRYMCELSGGQRQRVALARALVMEPKLLVADEITSMLDPSTQANLLRLLKGLQNTRGFAMLFVTHDVLVARKVCDRVVVLRQGRVVEEGRTERILGLGG